MSQWQIIALELQIANSNATIVLNFKRGFMQNHWLSELGYQKSLVKNISEAVKKSGSKSMSRYNVSDMDRVRMSAAEREFANSLLSIAQKYGKLSDMDNNGIWVGYVSEAENEDYEIGVRCENCVLHESESVCKIIKQKIEPGGRCRLAAIPDGLVNVGMDEEDMDDED